MTNLDEFFGDDRSRNIDTLVEITKKFFVFVSQLVEIVDELERNYLDLSNKFDLLLQKSESSTLSIPISKPINPSINSPSSPAPIAFNPSSPSLSSGLPTPPSPAYASASTAPAPTNQNQTELGSNILSRPPPSPSSTTSGLPPLPGISAPPTPSSNFDQHSAPPTPSSNFDQHPAPPTPSSNFNQPPLSPPSFGTTHGSSSGLGPTGPPPRPSPMSLKAQMNLELKEAFARIKKGWDEDS